MIHYTVKGNGPSVVLLHGFPLNSKMWDNFSKDLSSLYTVFTPDLPGFGGSSLTKTSFGINDVATEVIKWLEEMKIKDPVIIGHSLGGYVALAIAHLRPDLPFKIVLFHSTAFADSEEKKENRNKVIEFIQKNGVLSFTSNFIASLFADPRHPAVQKVREIAVTATEDTVVGYTQAMRDRAPRLDVMKDFPKPMMIIAGEKDGGIPIDSVEKQGAMGQHTEVHVLPGIAHMGMFENPDVTASLLKNFISRK